MRIGDARLAEVKDTGSEYGTGVPVADTGDQIVEPADAARRYHRHAHPVGDRARKIEVVTVARAVAVHAGDEQLARAEFGEPEGVRHRVDARGLAPAMREDFPAVPDPPRIDRRDDALAAGAV